jgi:hypothetical protein
MPPRKRRRAIDSATPDGSADVHKRSRPSGDDASVAIDSKHSVSAAAAASGGGGGASGGAASPAIGTDRTLRRSRPPSTSVITSDDYTIDSDEETDVAIAVSSVGWSELSVDAPPRATGARDVTDAAPGAGAAVSASPAPSASSSSSSSSLGAAASGAAAFYGPDQPSKVAAASATMARNHAKFAALRAATEAEREATAEKKAARKVSAHQQRSYTAQRTRTALHRTGPLSLSH